MLGFSRRIGGLLLLASALGASCAYRAHDTTPTEISRWVRDPGWPRPSTFPFDQVSWTEVEPTTDDVFVLQRSRPPVSRWSSEGWLLDAWSTDVLGKPHSLTLPSRRGEQPFYWITDIAPPREAGIGYGHCLKRFAPADQYRGAIGTCGEHSQGTGLDPVQFDQVTDVAADSNGDLFVTDGDVNGLNNRVLKLTPAGDVLMDWSAPGNQPGSGPKGFDLPHAVLVDPCDRVWVADAWNHRIQVIGSDGTYHGELACFGDDAVLGIAFAAFVPGGATLFTASCPASGGGLGRVAVFSIPMSCESPGDIGDCRPFVQWTVPLPDGTLLHDVSAQPDGRAIYLTLLPGTSPPQKWIVSSGDG